VVQTLKGDKMLEFLISAIIIWILLLTLGCSVKIKCCDKKEKRVSDEIEEFLSKEKKNTCESD
jgi:hypothetical protein